MENPNLQIYLSFQSLNHNIISLYYTCFTKKMKCKLWVSKKDSGERSAGSFLGREVRKERLIC